MIATFFAALKAKISVIMVMLFGANWRTTFFGIMAILPQLAQPIQTFCEQEHVSAKVLNGLSLFFALITVIVARDSASAGTGTPPGEGK